MVGLVTFVIIVLSWLYLNSLMNALSTNLVERSELASQQVNAFIVDRLNKDMREYPVPAHFEQTKIIWRQIVYSDPEIATTLERTMAMSKALVEINVFGDDQLILASSSPSNVGRNATSLPKFQDWRNRPFYRRLFDLVSRRDGPAVPDYEVVVPLGIAGQKDPIFTVQVVDSSVLLRNAVLPEVEKVASVAAAALLGSLLITGLLITRALQPIRRIEQTIDGIAQGKFHIREPGAPNSRDEPKEFMAVESKLNLLGQQYSGVQQSATNLRASLEEMVERMASQLDVATRLAAISRLTGGVAHEIKNPLNAISLRLDLLRARAEGGDEQLIPEIDVLSKEVNRLDRVVKTFLDFSRPLDVRLTDVDLAALAGEVTTLMTPQARASGIELTFEAPLTTPAVNGWVAAAVAAATANPPGNAIGNGIATPVTANEADQNANHPVADPADRPVLRPAPRPAWIRGDADLLKQAVLNLVTNAMEALKQGGRVRVSVYQQDDSVVLEVADNGPGIPQEVQDKVFQLYFSTKEKGSGIGLAMAYRAVQLHNGTIDFLSEAGRGTKFQLRFPVPVRHV